MNKGLCQRFIYLVFVHILKFYDSCYTPPTIVPPLGQSPERLLSSYSQEREAQGRAVEQVFAVSVWISLTCGGRKL
jgi:hypothetical protein